MKRALLLSLIFLACQNPLDKVYEPATFRTDFRSIKDYDSLSAKNIEYVLEWETPEIGATYKEILDRYSQLKFQQEKEVYLKKVEDSIRMIMIEEEIIEREKRRKILLEKESEYQMKRAPHRQKFIEILDDWAVEGNYRKVILQEFDETVGELNVKDGRIEGRRLIIDIGPRTLSTFPNFVKAKKYK